MVLSNRSVAEEADPRGHSTKPVLLLDFSEGTELAVARSAHRRSVVCETASGVQVTAFYPGAFRACPPDRAGKFFVLIKPFPAPRAVCSHFLIAGDGRIHPHVSTEKEAWCGFTTLFNNMLFEKILENKLWVQEVQSYRKQVPFGGSRLDFLLNQTLYVQVKADFVLFFKLEGSRFQKHLGLLNQTTGAALVFIAPWHKEFSGLYRSSCAPQRALLRKFTRIRFYWAFVQYDKQGCIWLNGPLETLGPDP